MQDRYNLDIDAPEKFPGTLEAVADLYRDSTSELQGAWQDEHAGKIWSDFANILERAAASARRALDKRGFQQRTRRIKP
jgi:hypothetical protein